MCGLDVVDLACDIELIDRPRDGIRRDSSEYLFLLLQASGRAVMEQANRQTTLHPGDLYLLDSTRVAKLAYQREPSRLLSLHLPRATLLAQTNGNLRIGERLAAHRPEAARLHRIFADGLSGQESAATATPEHLFDLARLAFSGEPDDCDGQALDSTAGRYLLAVREIEANLSRPELSLPWLARRVGISERQLQRDFLSHGESFVRLLRERRLMLAAEKMELARRTNRPARIIDIAFDAGFRDLSNFNRAFRARFACRPSEYAAAS